MKSYNRFLGITLLLFGLAAVVMAFRTKMWHLLLFGTIISVAGWYKLDPPKDPEPDYNCPHLSKCKDRKCMLTGLPCNKLTCKRYGSKN